MTRASRPERKRIFAGCEGPSEESYCGLLTHLTRECGLAVHIDPHVMKGGDPLARMEWVSKTMPAIIDRRGDYAARFAFLDEDQMVRDPDRAKRAIALAIDLDVTIIQQRPDHEGLLLLHFEERVKGPWPQSALQSMDLLRRRWPGYEKNSTAMQYGKVLDPADVERAGLQHADLHRLLLAIGLVKA